MIIIPDYMLIYNTYLYKWCDYRYVSTYVIGFYLYGMSWTLGITTMIGIYVDNKQLQIYLFNWSHPTISLHLHFTALSPFGAVRSSLGV